MKKQLNLLKRVALYARVSTLDKGQDPHTQLHQLREYAQRRNFQIIGEFIDYASGTSQDRTQYKWMMEAARKRKVDVVLVWRYDRFARSTQALVNAMKEFQSLGLILSPIKRILTLLRRLVNSSSMSWPCWPNLKVISLVKGLKPAWPGQKPRENKFPDPNCFQQNYKRF